MARFAQLEELSLPHSKLKGAGLKELAALKNLHSLDLSLCDKLTDDGMKEIAGLVNLRNLNFSMNISVTSVASNISPSSRNCDVLFLHSTSTQDALLEFAALKKLRILGCSAQALATRA